MRLLSKKCVYGIRAALYVASVQENKKYIPIRQISEELQISFHFLTKILQVFTQKKIMDSFRGPNGGIALTKASDKISLLDIIYMIDGDDLFDECILGLPGCGENKPCPFHDEWKEDKECLKESFANTTLSDLVKNIKTSEVRIS